MCLGPGGATLPNVIALIHLGRVACVLDPRGGPASAAIPIAPRCRHPGGTARIIQFFKPGGATLSNSISLIHPGPGQVLSGSHSSGLVDHVQHATRPTHRALPPRPLPTPASVIQRSRHYARTWCTRPQHDGPGAACAHARALRTARLVPFLSQWWRSGRTASPHRAWFGRAGWCAGPGAPEQLGVVPYAEQQTQ